MQQLSLSDRYPRLLLNVALDIQDRGVEGLGCELDAQRRVTQGLERHGDASFGTGSKTVGLAHGLGHARNDVLNVVLENGLEG